ncbi:MAG: hypothetical protein JO159_12005 [Acidobacteria bacterium]|nr:hypothetical protein [Acidobacteriota bacterium]
MNRGRKSAVPLWLKLAWTVWLSLWATLYGKQYGAQNFLYFCDLGNFLIAAGLWTESRLIFSWQAVGLLVFQTLYASDLVAALLFGAHTTGGTEYMFDPRIPLAVRAFGLYHLVVPILLLWAVRRLGYDPRAWKCQVVTAWIVVPVNYFWRPQYNVNWARGLGHWQHFMPGWLYLIGYLVAVPLIVYWPTHVILKWWTRESPVTVCKRAA